MWICLCCKISFVPECFFPFRCRQSLFDNKSRSLAYLFLVVFLNFRIHLRNVYHVQKLFFYFTICLSRRQHWLSSNVTTEVAGESILIHSGTTPSSSGGDVSKSLLKHTLTATACTFSKSSTLSNRPFGCGHKDFTHLFIIVPKSKPLFASSAK